MIENLISLRPMPCYKMKLFSILPFFILLQTSCNNKPKEILSVVVTNTEAKTKIEENSKLKDTLNITSNFVLGKFDYKSDSTFVKVDSRYTAKDIYLNYMTYKAFLEMSNKAKRDSIDLKIISGTRNFYEQKAIWNRKWNLYNNLNPIHRAKKILEYSSMPSTSRHHWGTDIDLNSLNNSYFNTGKGLKTYLWLKKACQ